MNVYAMDWRSQGLSGRHLLDPQASNCSGQNTTPNNSFPSKTASMLPMVPMMDGTVSGPALLGPGNQTTRKNCAFDKGG